MPNVKILIASHKPFKIPEGVCFVPVHAGRSVALENSKDGVIDSQDLKWMLENTIGDDTGDNISDKNRYYSECSVLYWAWKNYEKLGDPDYIGLMHYRRHFIFNDGYYENKIKDNWHKAFSYINENFIDEKYINNIGLKDEFISKCSQAYDLIVSKEANFKLIGGMNLRENYELTIPGAKVKNFDLLLETINNLYPEYKSVIDAHLEGSNAFLYQMFIMPKEMFFEYCEFLFDILFEIEKQINWDEYTTNGKRTLGYLAERILSFFVWKKEEEGLDILKLGISEVEYPYNEDTIEKMLAKGCPSYLKYLYLKVKSYFLKDIDKSINDETRRNIRRSIKSYRKLKNIISKS